MIGQTKLLQQIDTIINNYPKFSIIVGPKGSGKHLIVKYICDKLQLPIIPFGTGIDDVRQIIDRSYDEKAPMCYVCTDADTMSIGAKNALLKITEEPAENAHFILTLQSKNNTLETITSRGTVLSLDPYTTDELVSYCTYKSYSNKYFDIVKDICTTTGEVDALFSQDVEKFYKYANTVAFEIHKAQSGNIFKISKSVKSKDNVNGYDAILLFKTVQNLYINKAIETKFSQYLYAATVTAECLRDLALPNVNVVGTIDTWIMAVRAVLRGS